MAEGQYSRIYWCFPEEYLEIYNDDRTFATFVRLLLLADGTYPAPPPVPRNVRRAALLTLIAAGLLELTEDGDHYRIKGLVAERQRRKKQAKDAADKRWGNKPPADGGDGLANPPRPSDDAPAVLVPGAPALPASDAPASDENMPSRSEQRRYPPLGPPRGAMLGLRPAQLRKRAEDQRNRVWGRCQHEPRCESYEACIAEIVASMRARVEATA